MGRWTCTEKKKVPEHAWRAPGHNSLVPADQQHSSLAARALDGVPWCLTQAGCVACRAMILAKKVSPRAFKVVPNKKGEAAGEIGIEGTTIEAPEEVGCFPFLGHVDRQPCCSCWEGSCVSQGLRAACRKAPAPAQPAVTIAQC